MSIPHRINAILSKTCYAFYRLPDTSVIRAVASHESEPMADASDFLGRCPGFVVAPFNTLTNTPRFIPSQFADAFNLTSLSSEPLLLSGYEESDRKRYELDFALSKEALRKKECVKLVLARRVRVRLVAYTFNAFQVFSAACHAYPHNYVALWHTPETGTWITATPELLLSCGKDGKCRTMALAGTMSADNPDAQKLTGWSRKDIDEQAIVQQHIYYIFQRLGIPYKAYRQRIVPSGNLLHLRTDFSFPSPSSFTDLLNLLHPTPAVCGMPTRTAKKVLETVEHIRRDCYAGFTGPVRADGSFALYVTLRCLHEVEQGVDIFAGSGLLPQSTLEDEWQETERKLDAIRRVMPLRK